MTSERSYLPERVGSHLAVLIVAFVFGWGASALWFDKPAWISRGPLVAMPDSTIWPSATCMYSAACRAHSADLCF